MGSTLVGISDVIIMSPLSSELRLTRVLRGVAMSTRWTMMKQYEARAVVAQDGCGW